MQKRKENKKIKINISNRRTFEKKKRKILTRKENDTKDDGRQTVERLWKKKKTVSTTGI